MATLFGPAPEVASTSVEKAAKAVNGQNIPRVFPQKIDTIAMRVQPAYILMWYYLVDQDFGRKFIRKGVW
jgi:hypothetical protein